MSNSLKKPLSIAFVQFSGLKENDPKNWFCPILKDGNTLTHKIEIYGLLKTPVEFFYGRGARDPLRAPRLFEKHNIPMISGPFFRFVYLSVSLFPVYNWIGLFVDSSFLYGVRGCFMLKSDGAIYLGKAYLPKFR